jgi:hypothetical protein
LFGSLFTVQQYEEFKRKRAAGEEIERRGIRRPLSTIAIAARAGTSDMATRSRQRRSVFAGPAAEYLVPDRTTRDSIFGNLNRGPPRVVGDDFPGADVPLLPSRIRPLNSNGSNGNGSNGNGIKQDISRPRMGASPKDLHNEAFMMDSDASIDISGTQEVGPSQPPMFPTRRERRWTLPPLQSNKENEVPNRNLASGSVFSGLHALGANTANVQDNQIVDDADDGNVLLGLGALGAGEKANIRQGQEEHENQDPPAGGPREAADVGANQPLGAVGGPLGADNQWPNGFPLERKLTNKCVYCDCPKVKRINKS